jgi:hypothetical protein
MTLEIIKPRDITDYKKVCRMVTFHPIVTVCIIKEDGYDRRSVPYYNMTYEDAIYLDTLRRMMLSHQFISDNPNVPPMPLPPRDIHFNRYYETWHRFQEESDSDTDTDLSYLYDSSSVERLIQMSPYV